MKKNIHAGFVSSIHIRAHGPNTVLVEGVGLGRADKVAENLVPQPISAGAGPHSHSLELTFDPERSEPPVGVLVGQVASYFFANRRRI